jgi:hypothetical protein
MGMSYQLRRAVIPVPGNPASVRFLNLDTAEVVKECEFPRQFGWRHWLADVPGQGASLEIAYLGKDEPNDPWQLYALVGDPLIPCKESLREVSSQQVKYAVPQGGAGVGDFSMGDEMDEAFADSAGKLSKWMGVGRLHSAKRNSGEGPSQQCDSFCQ